MPSSSKPIQAPPSRGTPRNYGKQVELPMLKVEGEGGKVEDEGKENINGGGEETAKDRQSPVDPSGNVYSLTNIRSLPNAATAFPIASSTSASNSPISNRKRTLLPPSGIKLPAPPSTFPEGATNGGPIHKSISSASLYNNASSSMYENAQSQMPKEAFDRTVPNAAQMIMAARERVRDMAAMSSPRAGARLPPLQMPKMPKEGEAKEPNREGKKDQKMEEGDRMIATVADHPLPQLQPLELPKNVPNPLAPLPPPPYTVDDLMNASSVSMPLPMPRHHVPNEVPPHQHPPRRRPSSAGALPLTAGKPLPAISEPIGAKRPGILSRGGAISKHRSRSIPWRVALKCVLISGFLAIPIVIFLVMMLSTDGVANSNSGEQNTTSKSIPAGTTQMIPIPASTDVNIVGGAIFQPISMQNESASSG